MGIRRAGSLDDYSESRRQENLFWQFILTRKIYLRTCLYFDGGRFPINAAKFKNSSKLQYLNVGNSSPSVIHLIYAKNTIFSAILIRKTASPYYADK